MIGYVSINQKGQVTIPASIRKNLDIKSQDQVLVSQKGDSVVITLIPEVFSLRGSIPTPKKSPTNNEMKDSFAQYLASRSKNE